MPRRSILLFAGACLAIAAALASEAQLLLLDEPTALLDEISQAEVLQRPGARSARPASPWSAATSNW